MLLNNLGGVVDDLMISRRESDLYLVVNGATKWDDIAYMQAHLPGEIILEHLQERALLALQGPKAANVLARHIDNSEILSDPNLYEF